MLYLVRKHRAPKGALRQDMRTQLVADLSLPDITERQKVH